MQAAAIVPAYNEEPTIGEVVRVLVASGEFGDVIVISDGSTDQTAARARESGATLVHEFPERQGKGAALLHGLRHTRAPIVFFVDADLRGFRVEHVRALLEPVVAARLVMAVGLRDRGYLTAIEARLPLIGGERALRREVIEDIRPEQIAGFKVEQALNYHCELRRWRYAGVFLAGLNIRKKYQKVGVLRAIGQYTAMYWQVLTAMVAVRLAARRGIFLKPTADGSTAG